MLDEEGKSEKRRLIQIWIVSGCEQEEQGNEPGQKRQEDERIIPAAASWQIFVAQVPPENWIAKVSLLVQCRKTALNLDVGHRRCKPAIECDSEDDF
jgi:hypothetical protein